MLLGRGFDLVNWVKIAELKTHQLMLYSLMPRPYLLRGKGSGEFGPGLAGSEGVYRHSCAKANL